MDIIEKARELGRLIQEEDSYKKLQDAQKNADADIKPQHYHHDGSQAAVHIRKLAEMVKINGKQVGKNDPS